MIARGACIGALLICLRRFDGKAGRFAAIAGEVGPPPGILKLLASHGCTPASGLALIQAFAAGTSSSTDETTSSIRPTSLAAAGPRCWPCSSTSRSEEHTSELQSRGHLVCRLLLAKKNLKTQLQPAVLS